MRALPEGLFVVAQSSPLQAMPTKYLRRLRKEQTNRNSFILYVQLTSPFLQIVGYKDNIPHRTCDVCEQDIQFQMKLCRSVSCSSHQIRI